MHKSQIGWLAAPALCLALLVAGCSHVGSDWKAAQQADTTEAYQEFLRLHPDTEFTAKAQERLKDLAEQKDWELAVNGGTADAYQQFLVAHADGKNAAEARTRMEELQQAAAGGEPAAPGAEAGTAPSAGPAAPPAKAPMAPAATAPAAKAPATQAAAPKATAPKAAPAAKAAHAPATHGGGAHAVQLGAYATRAGAVAAWDKISARLPGPLGGLQPHYASGKSGGKPIVRLQVKVATREAARSLCAQLKKHKQACVVAG